MNKHGQWEMTLVNDVLVRSVAGHFNLAGTISCFQEMQEIAPKNRPWGFLGNAQNWEMSSEDSFKMIKEMKEWKFKNGCMCSAIIIPTAFRKKIYQINSEAIPSDTVKYFDDLESAAAWLTEKGFPFLVKDYPHNEFIRRTSLS